jgi:hypothetical protein
MSVYTVVWWPPAERDLADIWLKSPNRQLIADAANIIERQLADSPEVAGESGPAGFRRLFVQPLFVQFTVSEADRLVRIVSVVLTR